MSIDTAAPGGRDPEGLQKATSFADFFRMLENGDAHFDAGNMLRELNGLMENHAAENSGRSKGKMTLVIDFKLEKGIYEIEVDQKITPPKTKRGRTIAYGTPEGFFSRQDPKQLAMFGGPRKIEDPMNIGRQA